MLQPTKHWPSFDTSVAIAQEGLPALRRRPCPYRKLDPDVLMVESTEHRPCFDPPVAVNGPSLGRILT
jgi:hypothetical protein